MQHYIPQDHIFKNVKFLHTWQFTQYIIPEFAKCIFYPQPSWSSQIPVLVICLQQPLL